MTLSVFLNYNNFANFVDGMKRFFIGLKKIYMNKMPDWQLLCFFFQDLDSKYNDYFMMINNNRGADMQKYISTYYDWILC